MSILWCIMMVIGLLSSIWEKKPDRLLTAILDGGKDTLQYLVGLVGIMAFWSGIYGVVEKTGALGYLTRKIAKPVFRRVFKKPLRAKEEEAVFASIAANLLGLGNAATVWGLRAMMELKKGDRLTPNIATFLILLSSGLTVFPSTIINLRALMNSKNPAGIWIPALIVSTIATILAVLLDRVWGERE